MDEPVSNAMELVAGLMDRHWCNHGHLSFATPVGAHDDSVVSVYSEFNPQFPQYAPRVIVVVAGGPFRMSGDLDAATARALAASLIEAAQVVEGLHQQWLQAKQEAEDVFCSDAF